MGTKLSALQRSKLSAPRKIKLVFDYTQWQAEAFLKSSARFRVICAGWRSGKSLGAVQYMLEQALINPGHTFWWVAPSYPVSEEIRREYFDKMIPTGLGVYYHRSERSYQFHNGARIVLKSGDNDKGLVAAKVHGMVIDECSRVQEDRWTNALRGRLTDTLGWAIFISTPLGMDWFNRLWLRGRDSEHPDWESWQIETGENPFISRQELIDAANELSPALFQQNYLAKFLADGTSVFTGIRDCIADTLSEPKANRRYVIGVDLAKSYDYTVVCVGDKSTREVVDLDRFSKVSSSLLIQRVVATAKKYAPSTLVVDTTGMGGSTLGEDLSRRSLNVIPYNYTNETKRVLIDGLALAMEEGHVKIPTPGSCPAAETLIGELERFTLSHSRTGKIVYSCPSGDHDDTVNALALMVYGMGPYNPHADDCPSEAYGESEFAHEDPM